MTETENRELNANRFLDLIQQSRRGKFKVYIGMSAGVGKSYRMLQEAHALLRNGINVKIGYIETHGRKETEALVAGLPVIPRKRNFYKGKELEEMDLQAILNLRPEVVIVDELAHHNMPGSKNEKRWQDVVELIEAGINVISAVNIQHLESLYQEIHQITGIEVQERVPDRVLRMANEVVNIDLTADELITRLKEGHIYHPDKVQQALGNFFQQEKILQLRELALKEVASQVERKIETEVKRNDKLRSERFLACINTNDRSAKNIIRKTARLASYYNSYWYVLYVQTPNEDPDKINLALQRHLLNNFKLATELGAEVLNIKSSHIADTISQIAEERKITTIMLGKPHFSIWRYIFRLDLFNRLVNRLSSKHVDIVILA